MRGLWYKRIFKRVLVASRYCCWSPGNSKDVVVGWVKEMNCTSQSRKGWVNLNSMIRNELRNGMKSQGTQGSRPALLPETWESNDRKVRNWRSFRSAAPVSPTRLPLGGSDETGVGEDRHWSTGHRRVLRDAVFLKHFRLGCLHKQ